MQLPLGLIAEDQAFPTVFVDTAGLDLRAPETPAEVNDAIYQALRRVHPAAVQGQALVKVHIGEPKCVTRMDPKYVRGSVQFLDERGASGIAAGDTTVAYSGPRGHRQNPPGDASQYLELAKCHGWSPSGPLGKPFVVLDRPSTSVPGKFEFDHEQQHLELQGIRRFHDFYLAGGFAAADFVLNHAHLTLHGLAGFAGCVKSIAMGCSSLRGKLRMHQALLPQFDANLCVACGRCVESCPEGALEVHEGAASPSVDPELCIGCGECEAICAAQGQNAIILRGHEITDWQRGEDTLPLRMADYTMGLMHRRWESTIHVLHMYTITERCDCVDIRQQPMLEEDIGFLVGKNPFNIDALAGKKLADALREEKRSVYEPLIKKAERTAAYVQQTYGLLRKQPPEVIRVS